MQSPKMGETTLHLHIFHHQVKPLVLNIGCIQMSCWTKEPHRNPQILLTIAKAMGCSTQNDRKTLMLKMITYFIEHEEVVLVPNQILHLQLVSVHDTGRHSEYYHSEEKSNHQPSYKPIDLQLDLSTRYNGAIVALKLWE